MSSRNGAPDHDEALDQCRRRLRELVHPERGQIPSLIFGDPLVYELEMDNIFARSWLLAAHESEVPEPGDYVTRYLGEQNAIIARGEDGVVRVFLNCVVTGVCESAVPTLATHRISAVRTTGSPTATPES